MATSDWVVPAITGGAAIAAAVGAQTVAAVFTDRREERRLAWEKAQAAERTAAERRARFRDDKREIFVRFLAANESFCQTLQKYFPPVSSVTVDEVNKHWEQIDDANNRDMEAILLLAPDVASAAESVCEAASAGAYAAREAEAAGGEKWARYVGNLQKCRRRMSEDLGAGTWSSDIWPDSGPG